MKLLMTLVLMALTVMVATATKPQKYLEDAGMKKRAPAHEACQNADDFQCTNGLCIQPQWVCDNDNDCLDWSDELGSGCTHDCRGRNKFNCTTGGFCIPMEYRCDGKNDCSDHSDEAHCELVQCPSGEFRCDNHICIENTWVCDGSDDCHDNSDENSCVTCKAGFTRCASSHHCIRSAFLCDGDFDCDDKSDEANCPVSSTSSG